MKATNKDGKRNATIVKDVVRLRDVETLSWTNIRARLAERKTPVIISGSTVRRIYDEGKGYRGAHNDSRPLPGGRYKGDKRPEATKGVQSQSEKATAKATARAKQAPATPKASKGTAPKRGSAAGRGSATKATRKTTKATPPTAESTKDKSAEAEATSQAS